MAVLSVQSAPSLRGSLGISSVKVHDSATGALAHRVYEHGVIAVRLATMRILREAALDVSAAAIDAHDFARALTASASFAVCACASRGLVPLFSERAAEVCVPIVEASSVRRRSSS